MLRERDWGDFTGRHIPDLKGLPLPENVEKMDDLLIRAKNFMDWVKVHYPNMVVLAAGHGIINKAIQAVHYGKRTREIPKMQNAEYCKYNNMMLWQRRMIRDCRLIQRT